MQFSCAWCADCGCDAALCAWSAYACVWSLCAWSACFSVAVWQLACEPWWPALVYITLVEVEMPAGQVVFWSCAWAWTCSVRHSI